MFSCGDKTLDGPERVPRPTFAHLRLRAATWRGERVGGHLRDPAPRDIGPYNGWIRRHRGPCEARRPAPWRSDPPVSDAMWARVEEVRRAKTRGGGARDRGRVDLLGGLLICVRARIGACAAAGCYGAPDRIRTCDLRLRRPTLYPLSYRRAHSRSDRARHPSGRRSIRAREAGGGPCPRGQHDTRVRPRR